MAMDRRLMRPWRIGVSHDEHAFPKELVRTHQAKLSAATTLSDLAEEYAYYTPALLYMGVRLLGREPFLDFIREYGQEVVPLTIRFNKPLFSGLSIHGDEEWNYVLYAIDRQHWPHYLGWVGTMTFTDRDLGLVTRIRHKEIPLADPLFLERTVVLPDVCPTVAVTAFCLDTNRGCSYLQAGTHPVMDLPYLVRTPETFPDTLAFAQAILNCHPSPYRHVDQSLAGDLLPEEAALRRRLQQQKEQES